MSARRLAALLLACTALAGLGLAARAAAPRGGGAAVRPGAEPALAAAQQAAEPQGGGQGAPPDTGAVTKRMAYAAALPDSAGRGIAERWCVLCHSAMLITQQAKDSTAWEKTIAQMEKWGVVVTPEEHDTLRTYLTRSFGPRVKPAAPARPAAPAPAARDSAPPSPTPR
jgi:hypothetical protein